MLAASSSHPLKKNWNWQFPRTFLILGLDPSYIVDTLREDFLVSEFQYFACIYSKEFEIFADN